jgi:hypothetical protein
MTEDDIETNPDNTPLPAADIRNQLVAIAKEEVGEQDAAKYWGDVLPGLASNSYPHSWCGGFTLWALHQVGLAKGIDWEIGKGYCYHLPTTRSPQPGDIAYFDKPYQHHAIVISTNYGGMLQTVDGNQPGETVRIRIRRVNDATAFYSIQPLIEEL